MELDLSCHVVIATRNRCERLLDTLERLRSLPERPPVVVVDNGSTDGTGDAVRRVFPDVHVVPLDRNLGAAARNLGAEWLRSDLVAFCDDDSWWAPGALERAVEAFATHDRLGLVAARILVGPDEVVDPVSVAMARSPVPRRGDGAGHPILGFLACAAVVRREAFLAAGGFHPRFVIGGEEELLSMDLAALGWDLRYHEQVVVHHHPSPHRDSARRRRLEVRNALWTAWLRRPARRALRSSLHVARGALADRAVRAGVAEALRRGRWVLRERRGLPEEVERGLRSLGR